MLNNAITLESQIEIIQQAKEFLLGPTAENYQLAMKLHFSSRAGTHMRPILDHYLAVHDGLQQGLVNYNQRYRYSRVESCTEAALVQWQKIVQW